MPALTIRPSDAQHELYRVAAALRGQSMQVWLLRAADAAILHQAHRRGPDGAALAAELDRRAGAGATARVGKRAKS